MEKNGFLSNNSLSVSFLGHMLLHKLYINVAIANIFSSRTCSLGPSKVKLLAIHRKNHEKNSDIFSQKPKRFGCFVAAVLLILSPKELI